MKFWDPIFARAPPAAPRAPPPAAPAGLSCFIYPRRLR
ncbi:putative lipoprotein [Bordetella bronchiseptica OSU553]|nr:putative lipoprotein [Bordetella bronchiseptica OSU553]